MEENSGIFTEIIAWITSPVVYVPLAVAVVAGIDRLVQKTENEWDNKVWFKFFRKPLAAWLGKQKAGGQP